MYKGSFFIYMEHTRLNPTPERQVSYTETTHVYALVCKKHFNSLAIQKCGSNLNQ